MHNLHWKRVSNYSIESDTGHKVGAYRVGGKWKFSSSPAGFSPPSLGTFNTSEEAKDACQEHANES